MREVEVAQRSRALTWTRRWIGAGALTAAVAVLGAGGALAASLSDADLTIQPSRLPKRGGAPVTITVTGTLNQEDGRPEEAKAVTLRLDRQLAVHGAGEPTCRPSELKGKGPAEARQKCKAALVGSGEIIMRVQYPEQAPGDVPGSVLLFNGAAGHLITYTFVGPPLGPAAIMTRGVAAGRTIEISLPHGPGGVLSSFRFRLGRTWAKDGDKLGYLNGRCATGTLHNKVTLALAGSTAATSVQQRCQART
jgi:hypothetical protein